MFLRYCLADRSPARQEVENLHGHDGLSDPPQSANRTHAAPATVAVRKCDLPESQVPPAGGTSGKWVM
jgi:hypothetical protein